MASEEKRHYEFWKRYTEVDMKPDTLRVWRYLAISKVFGITFAIKLMENGERLAQKKYNKISEKIPAIKRIEKDERRHEQSLINAISEERVLYSGSMVLGLNDAIVELTGALAGLTLSDTDSEIIAISGLITGIASALSMASSVYLSTKTDDGSKAAKKNSTKRFRKVPATAAMYTGLIYLITVLFLVAPYFLLNKIYVSLVAMLVIALAIIFLFTFYVSVANDVEFWKRFTETAAISFGIAAIFFVIGLIV